MDTLSEKEKLFCDLYVNGCAPFAGNESKCYSEVFEDSSSTVKKKANKLLQREDVQKYINEEMCVPATEAMGMKRFITSNLMTIVEEASTAKYVNKKGTPVSPAALRSVAVNAAKALMDMYPVKEAQQVNIGSTDGAGVVFNVIVPDSKPTQKEGETKE